MFAHYRYKQEFYIPVQIEAFDKMSHHTEQMDTLKLLNTCKAWGRYTVGFLGYIYEKNKGGDKRQHDAWMRKK